jgi:plastocyanin
MTSATRLRSRAGIALAAGALLLAACGGGGGKGAASPSSSSSGGATHTNSITISNYMFSPMSVTVKPGSTVSVTNKDQVQHTLTATGGQFNTGDINHDQTKTFRAPTAPGTYSYICSIHQYMMGTITVS